MSHLRGLFSRSGASWWVGQEGAWVPGWPWILLLTRKRGPAHRLLQGVPPSPELRDVPHSLPSTPTARSPLQPWLCPHLHGPVLRPRLSLPQHTPCLNPAGVLNPHQPRGSSSSPLRSKLTFQTLTTPSFRFVFSFLPFLSLELQHLFSGSLGVFWLFCF